MDIEDSICSDFWFSTWTMSQNNVAQILDLFDKKKILTINALTGLYFKKREAAVYNNLHTGLKKRNQRLFSSENHAKVTMLQIENKYYVIEGSANFTANPRIEQFVITQSKILFEFRKEWMTEIFNNIKIKT